MKKILISIIAIAIAIIGVMQWNPKTYSQSNLPYPEPVDCGQSTSNEMALMKAGWNTNLQSLLNQEKPASEMVEEAYEGARTYRCWLNYLCETVLFSGGAPPEVMKKEGGGDIEITREHVDPLPGCLPTGDIEIPGTKLRYMPLCHVSKGAVGPFNDIQRNYGSCIKKIGLEASI
ncbi:hypothetical protein KAR91_30435, partial [Candidatus Pacearchaeota archaeon]|nr:hypothetical protein [Candidatus Pacearchaeota archaeon]